MKFPNVENTKDLLQFMQTFLTTFFESVELQSNKIICQNKIKTEIVIDEINTTTFDGLKIKRCFSAITHFPFLDLSFVGTINNFSAMSSLIVNKDDKTNKFISRFFQYEGETVHEKFLLPSLLTAAISNERMLKMLTKKIVYKVDEKSIDYDGSGSRWSQTNEFDETQ